LKDTEIAIDCFNRAIELEPEFALPYTGLSSCYGYLGATRKGNPKEVYPKSKEYALRAKQIDENLAETHMALANIHFWYEWDWDNAIHHINLAIDHNSNFVTAYLFKAMFLMIYGKFNEALEIINTAQKLDPFSLPVNYCKGAIYFFSGQYNKVMEQLEKILEIVPEYPEALMLKGWIYQITNDLENALQIFNNIKKIPGFEAQAISVIGCIYADMNKTDLTYECINQLEEMKKANPELLINYYLCMNYASLNEPDKMYQYMEKSLEEKDGGMVYIKINPYFENFRSDPRFNNLLKKYRFLE